MPRPRLRRRVHGAPDFTHFKPVGAPKRTLSQINLTLDETEAIRLRDFLGLSQEESARRMNVSQPTFHRILSSARKKIADFLINGKTLKIYGGEYTLE